MIGKKTNLTRSLYDLPLAKEDEAPYSFTVHIFDGDRPPEGSAEEQKAINNKARSLSVTMRRVSMSLESRGDVRRFTQRRGKDENGPYIRIFRIAP